MTLLILTMMMCSSLMLMTASPLMMMMILIMMTILTSITSGSMNVSFWYSYMLFLIIVGGMLIVFIYMTSVASNEKVLINMKPMLMTILPLLMIESSTHNNFHNSTMTNKNLEFSIMKYLNLPLMILMFMLMVFLIITLIATVKITKVDNGPLRQKY
uniref:NADH dehydrogenase subunit 6 n=1 Tax=Bostrichoidea sp. 6 KM-2017 TaxID=2219280 RepID=A0A346RKF1_9COLE|nr:NADH dehydrogenase subunit 6 [Bostrichoidea sp. 6 KM-2017]